MHDKINDIDKIKPPDNIIKNKINGNELKKKINELEYNINELSDELIKLSKIIEPDVK